MTFELGTASQSRLIGIHPSLVRVVESAIAITSQDFSVTEGLRSTEEEAKHVANGTSHTMNSKHLLQADGFGHAVDLVPFVNSVLIWSLPASVQWNFIYPVAVAMRQAAVTAGVKLRWGGVWDRILADLPADTEGLKSAVSDYCVRHPGSDFLDGPHFEIIAS